MSVKNIYKSIWNTPEARQAAEQASVEYSQAAKESGESACARGAVKYGPNGAAESINIAAIRECGKAFGKKVMSESKA